MLSPDLNLERRLRRSLGEAIGDFKLIEEGDRILVAVSGGKDSLVLYHLLHLIQKRAPIRFELVGVNIDQGQPGYDGSLLENFFSRYSSPYSIERKDTFSIVQSKSDKNIIPCALCSRLRRGILYTLAHEKGCNKLALGHHKDDVVNTFLLNQFFSGRLATMVPIYEAERKITVIRPMVYMDEEDIREYSLLKEFRILPCGLCSSQPDSKRREMAELVAKLKKKYPEIKNSIFSSISNCDLGSLFPQRE